MCYTCSQELEFVELVEHLFSHMNIALCEEELCTLDCIFLSDGMHSFALSLLLVRQTMPDDGDVNWELKS